MKSVATPIPLLLTASADAAGQSGGALAPQAGQCAPDVHSPAMPVIVVREMARNQLTFGINKQPDASSFRREDLQEQSVWGA